MEILNHKTGEMSVLDETSIYNYLKKCSGKDLKNELGALEKRIKKVEFDDYKKELQKEYRKRDFWRIFIAICKLARQNFDEGKDKESLKYFVMNVIGCVIGDITLETNNIKILNKILRYFGSDTRLQDAFERCVKDKKEGKVWIMDNKPITETINETIESILSQNQRKKSMKEVPEELNMKLEDYAKYNFALFSGVSLTEVESMLARGISRTYLHNILYGFIMRRILMDGLIKKLEEKDDLYLRDDLYLTGFWVLRCISTYYNPLDAIESIDAKLDDIGVKKCILFVPMYPSQNARRYSVYTYSEKKHEIMMLYLHDLYEMIEMDKGKIKDYLRGKRINDVRTTYQ